MLYKLHIRSKVTFFVCVCLEGMSECGVCTCACRYACMSVAMHVEAKDWQQISSLVLSTQFFWGWIPHWTWRSSTIRLGWLINKLQRSACLLLAPPSPSWGCRFMMLHLTLVWVLRIYTQVLMCEGQAVYQLSHLSKAISWSTCRKYREQRPLGT